MVKGRTRRPRGRPKGEDGFREHEFKHASSTPSIGLEAWQAVLKHRDAMPHADLASLDPGPRIAALMDGRDENVLFMGDAAESVAARSIQPPEEIRDIPVVGAIEVASETDFVVGTVVMRLPGLDGTRILPETVRLFDLKDGTGDLRLIKFSGANALNAYLWARICGRGLYVAVGLDRDHISLTILQALKALAIPLSTRSEGARRAVARSIVRSVQPPRAPRRRDAVTRGDMMVALHRQGIPTGFFDSEEEPAAPEELDRLTDRFALNPMLPEIQILMDLDRERSSQWSG